MRLLTVRLIISLIVGVMLVSLAFSYYGVRAERRRLTRDLDRQADDLGESLAENVEPHLAKGSQKELQRIVERFGNREHLDGVAIYSLMGTPIAITPGLVHRLQSEPPVVNSAITGGRGSGQLIKSKGSLIHVYALPLHEKDDIVGALAIVHDATYINAQTARMWRQTFLVDLVLVFCIACITLLIVHWSIVGPIAKAAQWMKALRTGKGAGVTSVPDIDLLRPLAREVESFAQSLTAARFAAEQEAQLRDAAESNWTAERLSVHVRNRLGKNPLFVVSNREPYSHAWRGKVLEVVVPPSGLVTALEPILRACDGTWVAHGSGEADQEAVNQQDSLRVPPEDPRYTLRRVWLTKQEEEGYYFGFANEGLWPLCHVAHVRPTFRDSDWKHYREVNQKFADAVLEEMAGTQNPLLLAQDYHFALLPRMIKKKRPDARVAIFWHIPWPHPETFSICPWQRELVDGLLGADLIGFHIQSFCTNFLQTVDRTLESRIDWEHFAIHREDHRTWVKPFPISVAAEGETAELAPASPFADRGTILRELGVDALFLAVGVDRVDYTKGIRERFQAIERLMEKYPEYQSKFTLVQIGAPSRTHIKRYHDLLGEVEAEADRINWRFQTGKWRPIVFLKRQHTHKEIQKYYRTADLCLVTALHDGMNLVAKEFVAAREDEQGVLILSQFTGAARELRDALIVNPYDIEKVANAVHQALVMQPEDRKLRMQHMRRVVKENNVYRWAGNLITELSEIRLESPGSAEVGAGLGASAD